jgi:hypothetical protein
MIHGTGQHSCSFSESPIFSSPISGAALFLSRHRTELYRPTSPLASPTSVFTAPSSVSGFGRFVPSTPIIPNKKALRQEMKPELSRRLIGGLAALFGAWWAWNAVVPPVKGIWSKDIEAFDIVFLLTIVPLMATPGILAVVFGSRLFREMRESSLKWVIGVFAVFFAFFLSSRASELLPSLLPEGLQHFVFLFVASLVAIFAYLFSARLLLRHLANEDHSLRSLFSRGVLILMAWQVWLLLSQVFREYSPIKGGYTHIPEEPWGILGLLVPIAVAYGLYRAVAPKLTKAESGRSWD